jgi:lysophospholipid acyltransferase
MTIAVAYGVVFRKVRNATVRDWVSLLFGLYLQYFVYEHQLLHVIGLSAIVYFLMWQLKDKCVIPVFLVCFSFMSYYHISRMIYDFAGWKIDISAIIMMDLCKMTALAMNYADMHKDPEDIGPHRATYKLDRLPSYLEFQSYIHFPGSCIIGPFFEYKDYRDFIKLANNYANMPMHYWPILKYWLGALVFSVIYGFIAPKFSSDRCYSSEFDFSSKPFWSQFLFVNIGGMFARAKYYAGFCFTQAAINACGLSYQKSEPNNWDRVVSVDILKVEIAPSFKNKIEKWNISVQRWLKHYVYEVVLNHYRKEKNAKNAMAIANLVTFLTSAFWHGFYFTYYYIGLIGFLLSSGSILVFKNRSKIMGNLPKLPFVILALFLTNTVLNYSIWMFNILPLGDLHTCGKNLWHLPLVGSAALFLLCKIIFKTEPKQFAKATKLESSTESSPQENGKLKAQ